MKLFGNPPSIIFLIRSKAVSSVPTFPSSKVTISLKMDHAYNDDNSMSKNKTITAKIRLFINKIVDMFYISFLA